MSDRRAGPQHVSDAIRRRCGAARDCKSLWDFGSRVAVARRSGGREIDARVIMAPGVPRYVVTRGNL